MARRSFIVGSGVASVAAHWDPEIVRYPDPNIKTLDPRFTPLVLGNAAVEMIATGCRFTEGPVWFGDLRCLLWSDIPNDRMMKWEEETGTVSLFRKPSHYANGNTRDRQGRLITCEMDTQRLTRTEYDGTITVLAETFDGKKLTGPNDVVVKSDGSIWFSDNGAGIRGNYLGHKATAELPYRVYRVDGKTGQTTVAVGDMERPNGLCFSPDEKRLYVVDTPGGTKTTHVYDVVDDGTKLANGRVFFDATPGYADGIRCDSEGNGLGRLFRRRGAGRRRRVCPRRQADRSYSVARALRQSVLRRPEAQPPLHGRQSVGLFALRRGAGHRRRIARDQLILPRAFAPLRPLAGGGGAI